MRSKRVKQNYDRGFSQLLKISIIWLLSLFIVIAGVTSTGWANVSRIYRGMIGSKYNIVFLETYDNNKSSGRYFYLNKGVDIWFNGTVEGIRTRYTETNNNKITGYFILGEDDSPHGKLIGQWSNPEHSKSFPVELYYIGEGEALYESLKTKKNIEDLSNSTLKEYFSYYDQRCSLDPERDADKIKQILKKWYSFTCEKKFCDDEQYYLVADTKLALLFNRFIEQTTISNGYCGGAYPMKNEIERYIYDSESNKEVKFSDLFEDYTTNRDLIIGLFKMDQQALAALSQEQRQLVEGCKESRDMSDRGFEFDEAKQELILYGNFAHVMAVCQTLPPLRAPILSLKPYLSEIGKVFLNVDKPTTSDQRSH
ncbi:MAG: hypothetical protein JW841_09855 [Deltaproteobacteria bacterium]|nr:hypothetical protein [Deltaproteobacteria bacterium]